MDVGGKVFQEGGQPMERLLGGKMLPKDVQETVWLGQSKQQ